MRDWRAAVILKPRVSPLHPGYLLLRHFGTVKAIERASLPDLTQVPGINAETARKIYEYFHERAG